MSLFSRRLKRGGDNLMKMLGRSLWKLDRFVGVTDPAIANQDLFLHPLAMPVASVQEDGVADLACRYFRRRYLCARGSQVFLEDVANFDAHGRLGIDFLPILENCYPDRKSVPVDVRRERG